MPRLNALSYMPYSLLTRVVGRLDQVLLDGITISHNNFNMSLIIVLVFATIE